MSDIVVYFSRKGYNYSSNGIVNLEVGNTEVVANMIAELTGADLFEIKANKEYPVDYMETTEVAKEELNNHEKVEVAEYLDNLEEYDTIYVGYPNWWGTMPMVVFTFLQHYDLSGKTIKPFCTHEGSGMGRSESDLKELLPNSDVQPGLPIRGSSVKSSKSSVEAWIN